MVKNSGIPIEVKKPFETVQELKDEYKIPSFEEFNKTYENDGNMNYDDLSGGDIGTPKSYGPGNSNSSESTAQKASGWVTGTFLTVATIACPPAGLASAAVIGTTGLAIKGASRFADKDSDFREFGDVVNDFAWGTIEKSAKQQMIVKGGKAIYKTI